MNTDTNLFAFDSTNRTTDENGFLHVDNCNLTKEQVVQYLGIQIPKYEKLGLEPDRIYSLYRPRKEIEKAVDTFNGVPLLAEHIPISSADLKKEETVGSIGTSAEYVHPYLRNSLVVYDEQAIDLINNGEKKQLSCSYRYDPIMKPGTFEGEPYDIVMTNLRANHVALVKKGRAGNDVVVSDSAIFNLSTTKKRIMSKYRKAMMALDEDDPEIERKECELAQAIIDLHKKPENKGEETSPKLENDSEPTASAEPAGTPEQSKAPESDKVEGSGAEASPAPAKEDDSKPEGEPNQGGQDPVNSAETEEDDGYVLSDEDKQALDACGVDAENPEIQKAFFEGKKYANKQTTEKPAGEPQKAKIEGAFDSADIIKLVDERNALYEDVSSQVGAFAYDGMGIDQVAAYGLKKLGLTAPKGHEVTAVRSYLRGVKKTVVLANDSSSCLNDSLTKLKSLIFEE